jgi:myo-inositol-1(or 4)-monophosphatase
MNTDQITPASNYHLSPEDAEASLQVVQDVFRQVRPMILERAGKIAHTDKADGSPVTDTDIEVENILQAELARRFPGLPVYGEESGYGDDLPAVCWLVDPIDGTKSFIENTATFTSMAVLIQDKEAVAAVIYNPSTDEMYVAKKGKGAYKNDQRLDLATMLLSNLAWCKDDFIPALNAILQPQSVVCEPAPAGGGYGFIRVADGQAAARFNLRSRGYIHDYAPGALLVREAGGAIIPIKEAIYTYATRSFVACHPALESAVRLHLETIRSLEN